MAEGGWKVPDNGGSDNRGRSELLSLIGCR
jgi:hypothetical protein